MGWLQLLGVIAVAVAAFVFARRVHPRLALVVFALVAALLALDVLAVMTGYRDADGIIDCWPHCSPTQDFVRVSLPLGAIVLVAGIVGGATRAVPTRRP